MPFNIASNGIDFGPVPDPNGGIVGALADMLNERNANQQTLRGLAAGGVIPAAASPAPSLASRLFGADLDGTPNLPVTGAPRGGLLSGYAPAVASGSPAIGSTSTRGANPEVVDYIKDASAKRGINPNVSLAVFSGEGLKGFDPNGNSNPGDGGSSFGPAQLHYGGIAPGGNSHPGLGDEFTAKTGLHASDPSTWRQQIDFSLDHVLQNGWGAWSAARKLGITGMAGVGQAPQQQAQVAPRTLTVTMAKSTNADAPTAMPAVMTDDDAPVSAQHPYAAASPQAAGADSAPQGPPLPPTRPASADAPQVAATPISDLSATTPAAQPTATNVGMRAAPAPQPIGGSLYSSVAPPPSVEQIQQLLINPATRPLGLQLWQQATQIRQPIKIAAGETVLSPQTGQPIYSSPTKLTPGESLVTGTGQPVARAPGNMDVKELGQDEFGRKIYGTFDPQTGEVKPISAPGNQDTAVSNSDIHGADFLATLKPGTARMVAAIAEGRQKLPTGQGGNSIFAQTMRAAVLQYDPSFDQADVDARYTTRNDFAHGTTAATITAGNTALQHLADLSDAAQGLGNGRFPLANKLGQAAGDQTGGNLAGKQYANALNDFAGELTKFYRGSGGSETDIQTARDALNPAQSMPQLNTSLAQQAKLISAKVSALQNQWRQGMGPLAKPYPIISVDSQAALDRVLSRAPQDSASAPASAAQAPQPSAAPARSPTGEATFNMPHPVVVKTPAEAQALPPGTQFQTPDGRIMVRH